MLKRDNFLPHSEDLPKRYNYSKLMKNPILFLKGFQGRKEPFLRGQRQAILLIN